MKNLKKWILLRLIWIVILISLSFIPYNWSQNKQTDFFLWWYSNFLLQSVKAAGDSWILWDFYNEEINKNSKNTIEAIKTWDIHMDNIPNILIHAINFLMWIAWTISIIFIIIWAYKILFWSLSWSSAEWKDTVIMAVTWFAIASLSWFIIKFIIDNFW